MYKEIKLTFKEEDGKHDADTDACHCKEKKRNIKKLIKRQNMKSGYYNVRQMGANKKNNRIIKTSLHRDVNRFYLA